MLGFTKRLETWKLAFLNPKEAFKGLGSTKLGLKDGIENIGTAMIISFLVTAIPGTILAGLFNVFAIVGLLFVLAMYVVTMLILSFIYVSAMFVMTRIFGSKVSYGALFYAYSIPVAAITLVILIFSVISMIVALIPALGILGRIFSVIYLLIMLYSLYLITLAIKAVTKLSTLKALAVWFVPPIVLPVFGLLLLVMTGSMPSMAP